MGKSLVRAGAAVMLLSATIAVPSFAGVITSTLTDGDTSAPDAWPGTPVFQTTATPDVDSTVSNGGGNNVALTFTTGATPITLDAFSIIAAGGAGGTVNIWRIPQAGDELGAGSQGGTEADGFVNIQFSPPGLLGGGAGLPFTFDGTANETLLNFDLTGADEVTLEANRVYAIDFTGTGNFFVRRGGAFFTGGGNIYAGADPTQRFDVAGGRRDAPLALYAVIPEPTSLALAGVGMGALALRRRRRV